jgi:polysaccharide deacetylase family protein (PEP-CTERM system associated)
MKRADSMVAHHFTVDVEEYFQVSAFESRVPRERWGEFESRVVGNMMELLGLLAERDVRGTMFILGCVAEAHPGLVRELAAAGHEIASHGWDHRRITHQEPEEFRESIRRTKIFLEDLTGKPVQGFRAPSFSIVPGREWALDILLEEGYLYDSSLFPVRRSGYGYPMGERDPHWLERPVGRLAEVPPATLRRWGTNFPAAGGGYLRLLPLGLIRSAFRDAERRGVPATFYIHPWEIDPAQPRLAVPWPTRVRHYSGLARTAGRIRSLLQEFRFQPIAATLNALQVR